MLVFWDIRIYTQTPRISTWFWLKSVKKASVYRGLMYVLTAGFVLVLIYKF